MSTERQHPEFVLPLDDATAGLERVGGKGASLARLARAGLPVPAGFHVTTAAYDRFVEVNTLQAPISEAANEARIADSPSLDRASEVIAALFARGRVPDDVATAVRRAYGHLNDVAVAVRSSATAEDLPELSFAGQQETFLNVRGEAAVLEAVKRCWASLWTARAIAYRARGTVPIDGVSLAVVVQELVPADAAGVLFTANPLTGNRREMVVNAAWGLGEALVSGQVTPDTLVVDGATGAVLQQQVGDKAVMTVCAPEGTQTEAVPGERRAQSVLRPPEAAELARLGARIEALYGQPMDVEWAIRDGQIFILQARPITALPSPTGDESGAGVSSGDPWALPNPKGSYMRASVLELLPDPLSPLFATLGLPAWSRAGQALMRDLGLRGLLPDNFMTTVNGYGYYNLSLTPAQSVRMALVVLGLVGLLNRLLRTARTRWQAARDHYRELVVGWKAADLTGTPAVALLDGAVNLVDEAAHYYLTIQAGILPGAYMSEAAFAWVYERLYRRRGAPPALTFLLGYRSAPIQAEFSLLDLAQWVRAQPGLAQALAEMTPEAFAAAYQAHEGGASDQGGAWPAFWQRLDTHLARFGHAIFDLDFAKAVPADDPASLLETLRFFASDQAPDPHARQAAAEAAREQATRALLAIRPGPRLRLIAWLLRGAQGFAPLREDALADVGLGWPVLRRMLRELGRRLVDRQAVLEADDVFWLILHELRQAAGTLDNGQTPADLRLAVAARRATWQRQRAQNPPVALPVKGGTRFLGVDLARVMPARSDQAAASTILRGTGGSPGRVTGPARVIHGPEEFGQMRQGDVLVARITTPAWTPLFPLASGVVTDIGGPLSHSSIVAREYHIPAVLGTGVATEHLRSGQRVAVDGDAGTVIVVRPLTAVDAR